MTAMDHMRIALRLARRGYGATSPNPMVGAVLVKAWKIIGRGWHRRAGEPHAEIEALRDAERRGYQSKGATLYITLEPCSTYGRTPPCTEAIKAAGIRKVIVGGTDPNPKHRGKGFAFLRNAGIEITTGVLEEECEQLNEPFNHWIVHRTPFVTVKAAMTMDGKIATARGESKWITSEQARGYAMTLRQGADAVLVGINTILADDPSLTVRTLQSPTSKAQSRRDKLQTSNSISEQGRIRRIVLDARGRTPLAAKVVSDECRDLTTIIVSREAAAKRVVALEKQVRVIRAPSRGGNIDLKWLLQLLGREQVASLLV